MNKKIIGIAIIVAVAGWNIIQSQIQSQKQVSNLVLNNIDALAYSVSEGGTYVGQCCAPWDESCSYSDNLTDGRAQSIVVISCGY